MKAILASPSGLGGDRAALRTAAVIAEAHCPHIDALYVHLGLESMMRMVAMAPASDIAAMTDVYAQIHPEEAGRRLHARNMFKEVQKEFPSCFGVPPSLGQSGRSLSWLCAESLAPNEAVLRSRLYDLTVVARNNQRRCEQIPDLVMQAGRPILIAPATAPATVGQTVAIAWKPSAESARALTAAAPFIRQARTVILLEMPESGENEPGTRYSAEDLRDVLRWNGVNPHLVFPERGSVPGAIREAAYGQGADLLVMGAYGHSRMEEFVFGGVTRSILADCDIPVLMCH